MRAAIVILVSGCLATPPFAGQGTPVDAPVVADASFTDAPAVDPTQPAIVRIETVPERPLAGTNAAVKVTVQGDPNRTVFVDLSASAGSFEPSRASVVIDGSGEASVDASFASPTSFQSVVVVAKASYEADFTAFNSAPVEVAVDQQFGHPSLTSTSTLAASSLLAMRVSIPGAGNLTGFGITAASAGRARLAVYNDGNNRPGTLVLDPDIMISLVTTLQTIEAPGTGVITGACWIVLLVEQTTQLASDPIADNPNAVIGIVPKFTDPFPAVFPTATTNGDAWAMYITVGP